MAGGQNFTKASDDTGGMPTANADALFEDLPKEMLRLFKEAESYVNRLSKEWSKTVKDTTDAVGGLKKNTPGSGRLGLGTTSRSEKVTFGLGLAAVGAQTYMSMAPNTMAAVTQRLSADSYAGVSGMSSRQAILQANKQVGGGSTSAMGPTMAAMTLAYTGYTANSLSSKNIMSQLAGMSAQSGMTNEAAAASVGNMNGMAFLRAGVRIRDSKGNLKPISTIVNDIYNFLYRGRKISAEEAQLVYNPGSRSYSTLQVLTQGDGNLMQQIQAGIVARARAGSGKAYSSAMSSKDPNKMLDLLGVDKSSPARANFRYQSSETKKLASTEQGLVGGYDASLRTTASLNDAYSKMADLLGPVNDGLMMLKGILQTMPQAGGMGGTVSNLASSAMGMAGTMYASKSIAGMFGRGAVGEAGLIGGGALAGRLGASRLAGFMKGFGGRSLLKGGLIAGGSQIAGNIIQGHSSKGSVRHRAGNAAKWAGITAAIPFLDAAIIPELIAGGIGYATGGPNDHGNLGTGDSADTSAPTPSATVSPSPKGTKITSRYGNRGGNKTTKGFHPGIDFGQTYEPVYAWAAGKVTAIGNEPNGYGNWVEISHNKKGSFKTRYAHLKSIKVSRGQVVKAGDTIAVSGNTGKTTAPHMHFEILINGKKVDPAPYLSGAIKIPGDVPPDWKSTGSSGSSSASAKNFLSGSRTKHQAGSGSIPGDLSSASVSGYLSQLSSDGGPVSWQDVLKKLPAKDVSKYINSIPDTYTGPVTANKKDLIKTIASQGFHGNALRTAYAISIAESGGKSNGPDGDIKLQDEKWGPSIGLFQIRSLKHWENYDGKGSKDPWRDASRLHNPNYNVAAAWHKSKQGKNFKGWSTYTGGSFLKHLGEADSMAKSAGVGGPMDHGNLSSGFSPQHSTNQNIVISGGHSSSGNVSINLNMNVTISHGSVQEAERLVKLVGQRLKNDHTIKQIASSL
ncbi:Peptidase M23 [uncultured Caudovirales phage]|uniref:Peptidase M23 n=1 Tax=uncultured Caudovirales phage TaxID=2100421 RepID=A0A6J5KLY0_9CAUD|nr:Peptidase M23 [uncultured Caudovirales phage]